MRQGNNFIGIHDKLIKLIFDSFLSKKKALQETKSIWTFDVRNDGNNTLKKLVTSSSIQWYRENY